MRVRAYGTVAAVALSAAAPSTADAAFGGATVPDRTYEVAYLSHFVQPRVVCPPQTQSTTRPGDFSFCTGTIVITKGGKEVGRAPFAVRSFDSHVIKVPVRRAMRSVFPPHKPVRLKWKCTSHDGQGQTATRNGNMTGRKNFVR
jgi:hypothetical protein